MSLPRSRFVLVKRAHSTVSYASFLKNTLEEMRNFISSDLLSTPQTMVSPALNSDVLPYWSVMVTVITWPDETGD